MRLVTTRKYKKKTYSEEQHLLKSKYELLKTRQQFCAVIFRLRYFNQKSFCFDKDFEIESKYHRKTVVLLLIAHILSLQDVVLRSMFLLIFY